MKQWQEAAEHFLQHEKQFHLGMLPTEQSHPKTRGLAETLQRDLAAGLRMLMNVDQDVVAAAQRVLDSGEFKALVAMLARTLREGGRICFSGCGATGRLSILLETAWRHFWHDLGDCRLELKERCDEMADRVLSIMTGGDYALIRSVELFEDYASFGRQQVRDAGLGSGDAVVAISEGGETSSVIGSILEAHERGAATCFAFNNPSDILVRHVKRSRDVIAQSGLIKLDLSSGPMAVAGSTRMQATTTELLVIGAAVEQALASAFATICPLTDWNISNVVLSPSEYVRRFERLLADLARPCAIRFLTDWITLEQNVYAAHGRVTYVAVDALLDIFTDTTERGPTFMLPPFRKCDDRVSNPSWAFVKNPLLPTPAAWRRMLAREPRGLGWDRALYEALDGPAGARANPPRLDNREMMKFLIGNEDDSSRYDTPESVAIAVILGEAEAQSATGWFDAFETLSASFGQRIAIAIGPGAPQLSDPNIPALHIACSLPQTPLKLWDHLAAKLVFNLVSTATMGRMGRLKSNWMAHVDTTNKKLIDRGTRLIAEIAGVNYPTACYALHETHALPIMACRPGEEKPSPVALTIQRLRKLKR